MERRKKEKEDKGRKKQVRQREDTEERKQWKKRKLEEGVKVILLSTHGKEKQNNTITINSQ